MKQSLEPDEMVYWTYHFGEQTAYFTKGHGDSVMKPMLQ